MNYSFRARVNVLGAINAGKSELIRQLVGEQNFTVTQKKINIVKYHLETSQKNINVELWDFQSDVINNDAYKIFCASSCLYVLVINIREHNEDLDDWLYLITKYSSNPSILIVRNITQVKHGAYQKTPFKNNKYKVEIISVDFQNSLDIDNFKIKLHTYLEQKYFTLSTNEDNIIDYFKSSYDKNYIDWGDFKRICQENHIEEKEHKNFLQKLIHLGVCINFSSSYQTSLSRIIFINYEWLVFMINQIFDSKSNHSLNSIYSEDNFRRIWNTQDEDLELLLELLIHFNFCFEFKQYKMHNKSYIMPRFLPFFNHSIYRQTNPNEVYSLVYSYDLDDITNTQLDDIFIELITELHRRIRDYNEIYRDRFVLYNEDSNTISELTKFNNPNQHLICALVIGNQLSELSVVEHELDEINQVYGLSPKKQVPCKCKECIDKDINDNRRHFFNLASLRNRSYEKPVECEISDEKIPVSSLIVDVRMNKTYPDRQQSSTMDNPPNKPQLEKSQEQHQQLNKGQKPESRHNIEAVSPILSQIINTIRIVSVLLVIGGIVAIIYDSKSPSEISMLGQKISTGHVGVAFVFIGIIGMIFSFRKLLNTLSNIANPNSNRSKKRKKRK
ncbi:MULTISPECIES: COR domain-containing protein [Pseudanabaena]|uniref:COR domain-containing protein n=1 Tax=Pseudanabaena TaxID=1152 RepID=UPI00247A07B7|nr:MULTISPECIES: COR domain-containing protein [Pseudanabaena]MEA5486696.1 COR domain-containing protein [Pseudanabaena sp. CCNP1317]WGS73519.1 hypothetical protein OA858_05680 [Pseudanabaena galeata CCNP1313]